jgi:hypothetical protein
MAGLMGRQFIFFFQDGNANVRLIKHNFIRRRQPDNPATYHNDIKINVSLHLH